MTFPAVADLRPTPGRVRETLFNWLQMNIAGARCLDLFAGSGALGLEALSRGASEVIFVEKETTAARAIDAHLKRLESARGAVVTTDALRFLNRQMPPFDIVFLDPPYQQALLPRCCEALESRGWLTTGGYIYIEAARQLEQLPLPPSWQLIRSKQAGDVGYHLARKES